MTVMELTEEQQTLQQAMVEQPIERDLRDSVSSTLYSGTSEIQRNIIAKGLGR